ncbi:sterol desaturase family protein [Sphingobium boeckii]|uniref:Sterol desaturase/sphingolipid hydroxylase (Fatty acid hydroxylase superfamily) n=1 Tax=Sphingobium boeckii TaxID=1082345 RepID=A0A7W9AFT4_9SPHN|nr:sterol desaturase family protein [Sphingobium boeckii]MBB5684716.1 sterol desaturase/sphingolipid hydroxylase (fatty acid hydroxylase superfamily) [Sphingobium boeckii]
MDQPHGYGAGDLGGSTFKDAVFNLVPPATIAVVMLFWAFGPAEWIKSPWSIVVAGALTSAFIQGLEWVHERHAGWRIDRRELATDLFYVILGNTAIGWATATLAEAPLTAMKQSLGITTAWAMQMPFVLQVLFVIVLIEFGQYWMHRLMHGNAFFWATHAPHHHITQLNAMKGFVGNPVELFLISLSVVALFDLPQAALFCAFNVMGVISGFAHANVRSDPPRWYAFFFTTIRHHSLHHSVGYEDTRCNYGNSLILCDRIFGTYREGEASIVGQDDRKRLSIWEQTIFPVRPLIEKFREKKQARSMAAIN